MDIATSHGNGQKPGPVTPLPPDEEQRLKILRRQQILDSQPEDSFDILVGLAATVCETPIALLSFVDQDRQWIKSKVGLELSVIPRAESFCAYAILEPDQIMQVSDALADERFCNTSLVTGDQKIRFYAGAPLASADGGVLGTLSVMDSGPRQLSARQLQALAGLRDSLVQQIDQRTMRLDSIARTEILFEILALLPHEKPLQEILTTTLGTINRLGRWQTVGISLPSPDGQTWSMVAEERQGGARPQVFHPIDMGVIGRAYRTGQVQLVLDTRLDPDYFKPRFEDMVGSELAVPFNYDGQVLGVINLESEFINAFSTADVDFAISVADAIAVVLKNNKQYENVQAEIKQRRQVEATLRASEENYRRLAEDSPNPIGVLDRSGRIIYTNPSGMQVWHDTALIGKTIYDIFPLEIARLYQKTFTEIIDQQASILDEVESVVAGRSMWFRLSLSPLRDPDGNVNTLLLNALDITVIKEVEESLRESQQFFASAFEYAPIGMILISPQGHWLKVNQALCDLFGYSEKELLTLKPWTTHPNDRDVDANLTRQLLAGEISNYQVQKRFLHKSGRVIWALRSVSLVKDQNGEARYFVSQIVDISERKQIEIELREAHELLDQRVRERTAEVQDLYDNAPCGYVTLDAKGVITRVNNTLLTWLGYAREELIGRTYLEMIPPQQALQYRTPEYSDYYHHGGAINMMEYQVIRRDGTQFPIQANANSLLDESGIFIGSRVTVFDVSLRKQAEEQLRFQSQLLNSVDQAVIAITLDERINYWNEAAEKLYGWKQAEALGCGVREKLNFEIGPALAAEIITTRQAGLQWSGEMLGHKADGSLFWAHVAEMPVHDATGQPVGRIGISFDITQRKQAEATLRESENQNRLLFEESPDAILLNDQAGRIVRVNRAVEELTKIPREQMLGRSTKELGLILEQDYARVVDMIAKSHQDDGLYTSLETQLHSADGRMIDLESRVFPLKLGGKQHYLITNRDISLRKQADEAMRLANSEMGRALRLKDEFLATMSHELRTPLNGILGRSETLLEGYRGVLNEYQHKYVQNIDFLGRHLLSLINDILDLSKIEAGKLEIYLEPLQIDDVCNSSLAFIKEQAFRKGISLNYLSDPAFKTIEADPRRLKQILINLLSNAVKFTPNKGKVVLEVSADQQQGFINFSVKDTGIGIAPDDLAHLFTPFTQVDNSLSRQFEGSGLGLVLVKRMVEMHAGKVTVTSETGKGSCFTISLPWRAAPGYLEDQSDTRTSDLSTDEDQFGKSAPLGTVLLVEDNEINAKTTYDYLEQKGFAIFLARTGREALLKVTEYQPDIILMDIQIPELNGMEVIRQLRAHPKYDRIPIIALTALAMVGDRERCLAAGATDYLSKPFSLKQLVEIIRKYMTQD